MGIYFAVSLSNSPDLNDLGDLSWLVGDLPKPSNPWPVTPHNNSMLQAENITPVEAYNKCIQDIIRCLHNAYPYNQIPPTGAFYGYGLSQGFVQAGPMLPYNQVQLPNLKDDLMARIAALEKKSRNERGSQRC